MSQGVDPRYGTHIKFATIELSVVSFFLFPPQLRIFVYSTNQWLLKPDTQVVTQSSWKLIPMRRCRAGQSGYAQLM